MRVIRVAAALSLLLAAGPALAAPQAAPPADELTAFTPADALWLIAEMQGEAGEVTPTDEGFEVEASAYGLNFWIAGYDCRGRGRSLSCDGFEVSAQFEAKSPEQAHRWAREFAYSYVSDNAGNGLYTLTRTEFMGLGMSRARLRETLATFLNVAFAAWDRMSPSDTRVPGDPPAKPGADRGPAAAAI